ncbi:MAG TPA: hypothetical protein VMH80_10585 [Bryobacteraceae bacterium]|nr:hypothetical protein [Bryobacteraceae bacterium]
MNDRLSRAERLIEQLAGYHAAGIVVIDRIGLKIGALAQIQKRTTSKIDALRQLIQRNGQNRAGR